MMNLFDNDILFSQGDQAEELFFVFQGSALLYIDIMDVIDMRSFVKHESCFNVPIAAYSSGSYFGDNDVLLQRNGYRSHTAVCQEDCQVYTIKNDVLLERLEKFESIKSIMLQIAEEKQKYYIVLNEELKKKYKSKRHVEDLYLDKKNDEWTFYMSLKR
jgi:CRP-like cAMP-binding protein